jgi:hypothetical protein
VFLVAQPEQTLVLQGESSYFLYLTKNFNIIEMPTLAAKWLDIMLRVCGDSRVEIAASRRISWQVLLSHSMKILG